MFNLGSLNPQQREAVQTIRGPVLILAGAGTGKTRVITCRIAHMVQQGIPKEKILAVTFTNKAAREMQERVSEMLPRKRKDEEKTERPTIATFHSLCVRILRQHIEALGYKKNFVIYSDSEQIATLKKILARVHVGEDSVDVRQVLSAISKYKNANCDPAAVALDSHGQIAMHIFNKYQSALHACNAVDFDDLILLTLRLFSEHPAALGACREKYRYVMVDEYQDTNGSQFRLVHDLTKEHRNLCVVGDDDQSIYGWRGADVRNLLDLEKHYPEVRVVKLEQNYRSTNCILNAANAVIKNNTKRRGKQLWSSKGPGDKITLMTYPSDEEEATGVVEEIEFLRQARRVPWKDQAILFRTNLQSRPIEQALRKAKVQYHLVGGQSFFDRREIKDFVAYLRTFLNPNDDISLLRIANTPPRGLSDETMEKLLAASQERKCSVYEAMRNPMVQMSFQSRTRNSIENFLSFIQRHHNALNTSAAEQLKSWSEEFIKETRYFDEIRRSEKDEQTALNRVRNIEELCADLPGPAPKEHGSERLLDFLEDLTLDSDREDEKENTADAVTLITMHSCKGLEFPYVYIVGLEEGILPHSRSKLEGTLDEERRLFYVAITRAMKKLHMSYCLGRKKYGEVTPAHPSSFLNELPKELIESLDEQKKQPVTVDQGSNLFASMLAAISDPSPLPEQTKTPRVSP
ncbi:MAG TPA: UvrD-helicase domain-containing protein [Methylomirabilota bacterium]|nr:UvrD-helicase domain-containing protein [Methylomirabilota bacterium]